MLRFTARAGALVATDLSLTLPFEARQKARLHTRLDDGREAGLFLPRAQTLRGGDQIQAESGEVATIIAAPEHVSTVTAAEPYLLLCAGYHLGNRHVPLEIRPAWLRYRHDPVLDDMLKQLKLQVTQEFAPFEPEAGAYARTPDAHG